MKSNQGGNTPSKTLKNYQVSTKRGRNRENGRRERDWEKGREIRDVRQF